MDWALDDHAEMLLTVLRGIDDRADSAVARRGGTVVVRVARRVKLQQPNVSVRRSAVGVVISLRLVA